MAGNVEEDGENQAESEQAEPATAVLSPQEPQAYWMDQQGNVYFATGFIKEAPGTGPGARSAPQDAPGAAPMSIPEPAPNPYTSYPHGGYAQEWVQPQVYVDHAQYYYSGGDGGGGGYYGTPPDVYSPRVMYYPAGVDGTTPPGSPHGSPVNSPVHSPGQSLETMRALGYHGEVLMPTMQQQQPPQTAWEEIRHHVVALSKTRTGSVAIQWHLEHCSSEVFDEILSEMLGSVSSLINDRYGSHVTRQLVERCDSAQRLLIWQDIKNSLVKLACTRWGSWTFQALLDAIQIDGSPEQLAVLKKALPEESIVKLMKDQHGGHTIARCAQSLADDHSLFVFEAAANNLDVLCKHKYGCTTLQRMLESASPAASVLMAREVSKMGLSIAKDQYGNYIVQHVLGLALASCLESRTKLFDSLKGHFFSLSTHKYGSNIVEKCLKMGDEERSAVIAELTKTTDDSGSSIGSASSLEQLIVHPFGNYVAQSALILCADEELELFRYRLEAFAEASDKECEAQIVAAAAGQQLTADTSGCDSSSGSSARTHPSVEPFRKTVHGRKILQKLHLRTNKDKIDMTSGGSRSSKIVGAGGSVPVSVIDFKEAGSSSDAQGSRTGAAGAMHNQHKRGQSNVGGSKGGHGRGRSHRAFNSRKHHDQQKHEQKHQQQEQQAWALG